MVTSGMNNFTVMPNNTSMPDECTHGALSDLGVLKSNHGSLLHNTLMRPFGPTLSQPFVMQAALFVMKENPFKPVTKKP
jgi:hypothetical protein